MVKVSDVFSTVRFPIPITIVSIAGTVESVLSGMPGSMDATGMLSSCTSGVMLSKVSESLATGVARLGSSELEVIPSAGAYKVVTPGCDGASYSSSMLSLEGVDGGIGVPINIWRG